MTVGMMLYRILKLFRHGERAPTRLYPTDPNDPSIWPDGLGQLTIRGKLQPIHLGEYVHQCYSNLLSSTYKSSEITIRSSDYDRTLMSAYSTLVGLYPSLSSNASTQSLVTSNVWPESLPWQPILVHTVPESIDHSLFDFLEEKTGQSVLDLFTASTIADTIIIENSYNITPSWVTPTIIAQLHEVSFMAAYHLFYPTEINRLHGDNNTYAIQLDYLNTTNGRTIHPIRLPGCSNVMCPLETFTALFQHQLPKNMDLECQTDGVKGFTSSCSPWFSLIVINTLLFIFSYSI